MAKMLRIAEVLDLLSKKNPAAAKELGDDILSSFRRAAEHVAQEYGVAASENGPSHWDGDTMIAFGPINKTDEQPPEFAEYDIDGEWESHSLGHEAVKAPRM